AHTHRTTAPPAVAYHLRGSGASRMQPPLELGHRGRQNEDSNQILAHGGVQLLRALPVDVEQYIAARLERGLHRRLGRAVAVTEHRRPFDEMAGREHPVELGLVDAMIID